MTDESRDAILLLRGVKKRYGKTEALKGVDISVRPSEFVGLLGPNGAGKSTLFQIATGLFAPDGGEVEVFGLPYRRHEREIRSQMAVVFQARSIDLDMTVRANLKFHGGLIGLWGKTLASRIEEVTELLGITGSLKTQVRKLSGGNQRRVEIARALLNQPRLLLMDEPSAGLDAAARRDLVSHMHRICRERGTSILWATHLVEEVDQADRIILLMAGNVVADASPASLIAKSGTASLTDAYIALTGVSLDAA